MLEGIIFAHMKGSHCDGLRLEISDLGRRGIELSV